MSLHETTFQKREKEAALFGRIAAVEAVLLLVLAVLWIGAIKERRDAQGQLKAVCAQVERAWGGLGKPDLPTFRGEGDWLTNFVGARLACNS